MNRIRLGLAALAAALIAPTASADFLFTAPGPLITAGSQGNPGNGTFTQNFPGPLQIWGTLTFNGNISPLVGGTWIDDAQFRITTPGGGAFNYKPSTVQTYPANTPVTRTSSVFVFGAPGNFSFEAFDTFDDGAGPEAVWNSASFNFSNIAGITDLGDFGLGSNFTFDTIGSNFDTELGIFDSNGNLIATNDDISPIDLDSLIALGILQPGDYTLLAGGFDSTFANGGASAGGSAGNLLIQNNGVNFFNGALASGNFAIFQFSVSTPAPAAVWMGLIGAGALAGLRRRFAKV